MTGDRPSTARPGLSRRQALGLLGATPLAVGAGTALASPASAHVGAGPAGHGEPVPRGLRPGGELDQFLAQLTEADQFSGTVLLVHRGDEVLRRSHGMADQSRSIANGPDTVFNLASVSKCFTAVALGQLVEQGQVQPHEALGAYLDGFSDEMASVSIHQLLTHSAGIGDYPNAPGYQEQRQHWDSEAEMMDGTMAVIRSWETQPRFVPGSRHEYSNSGYFVLGAVVAQVSGETYYDYVRRHVLEPAGMRRSGFYTRPQVLESRDVAHPYWTQRSGGRADFTTSPYFGFVGGPAEGVYSTAPELVGFVRALHEGSLLSRAFVTLLTTGKMPLLPTDPPPPQAQSRFSGYGFRDSITGGQRVFGHSGSGPGTSTNLDIFPDLGWVAVVLSNYDTPVQPTIVQKVRDLITAG